MKKFTEYLADMTFADLAYFLERIRKRKRL